MTLDTNNLIRDLADFIDASPTSFHAAEEIARRLGARGFNIYRNGIDRWGSGPGGHAVIDGGAVIAWYQPERSANNTFFRIIGSHTDSPSLKLKPEVTSQGRGFTQVEVEIYGGPLLNSWLNRDLGIAGRIYTFDGETRLVKSPACMVIPQLAPHLVKGDRDVLELKRQTHMQPLFLHDGTVWDLLDVDPSEVAGHDLYTYVAEKPSVVGDYFSSQRQDNLVSAYASVLAMENYEPEADFVPVLAAFDHEEVGSGTTSGASGPLLKAVIAHISSALDLGETEYQHVLANSLCMSIDCGHSLNPNYPEHYDPANPPLAGKGPMIKHNAQQRYATDARTSGELMRIADRDNIPLHHFISNNDVPCGTTIGPLTATRLGIPTVDVGIPLLSMHSARELSHTEDIGNLHRLCVGLWQVNQQGQS